MNHLLTNVTRTQVCLEPFPHVIIENALPESLSKDLLRQYPTNETITGPYQKTNNTRFSYSLNQSLKNEKVASIWKDFLKVHAGREFYLSLCNLFAPELDSYYSDYQKKYGRFTDMVVGMRKMDSFADKDVLVDAQICINTPTWQQATSVRTAHVDLPNKLFVGLFYLREQDDQTKGGDLEIYKVKEGCELKFKGTFVDPSICEVVKTLKYGNNVAVFFPSHKLALHGVTVREKTNFTRRFFNYICEMKQPLFDLTDLQIPPTLFEKLSMRTRTFVSNLRGQPGPESFYN
ncbi:MAG: hypothetical protein AB7F43_10340 [Bacteriovoracia bacterium]